MIEIEYTFCTQNIFEKLCTQSDHRCAPVTCDDASGFSTGEVGAVKSV